MTSWQASIDTPRALVVALHVRDAAGLDTPIASSGPDVTMPPLEPAVDLDARLAPYATERAAAAWSEWWESLLNRHPEFRGVPPLVADPGPALDAGLRALIGNGLPAADAWFTADKHRNLERRRSSPQPSALGLAGGLGQIVRDVEAQLGRPAEPFDLVISILPVSGLWGGRVRRDHVLISRALSDYRAGYEALLEPVVRELAQG